MGSANFRAAVPGSSVDDINSKQYEDFYDGDTNEPGQYHGKGVLFYGRDDPRQRERYCGDWKHGLRHGKGILNWSNGAVYQGMWKEDMLHGMGVFHLPSGLCYEGEFFENKFQGLGVLLWKSGKKYEGSWLANRHHGYGCLTYPPSDLRKRSFYKGEWKSGKRHGTGTMKWTNGAKYVGEWVSGKREGVGKHIFPSSQVYIGHWKNGRREGNGCRYFCNGDRFDGIWQRDKKHGHGYYIQAHGRKTPSYHDHGEPDEQMSPKVVQSLSVLCIEKIAKEESLVKHIDRELDGDLARRIRLYRKNELHIVPHSVPFMNQFRALFSRLSYKGHGPALSEL